MSEIRRPPGSVAVTVTVAVPAATPSMLKVVPLRDTVAVPGLLVDADSVRASPSGSLNTDPTATVAVAFTAKV